MKLISRKFIFFWCLLILAGGNAFSQEGLFKRVQLPHGISMEVPSHWVTISADTRKNLTAMGAATMENAGLEASSGQKVTLLAMNAVPNPTGATIRLSLKSPPSYSQADLAAATVDDLKEMRIDFYNAAKQVEASGGVKVIEVQPFRIEKINGQLSLAILYVREGSVGTSNWQSVQYKIPTSGYLIEMTLSHRQSDAVVWKPILEKVKRSVRF